MQFSQWWVGVGFRFILKFFLQLNSPCSRRLQYDTKLFRSLRNVDSLLQERIKPFQTKRLTFWLRHLVALYFEYYSMTSHKSTTYVALVVLCIRHTCMFELPTFRSPFRQSSSKPLGPHTGWGRCSEIDVRLSPRRGEVRCASFFRRRWYSFYVPDTGHRLVRSQTDEVRQITRYLSIFMSTLSSVYATSRGHPKHHDRQIPQPGWYHRNPTGIVEDGQCPQPPLVVEWTRSL
jgi:hypothetical protein